MISSTIMEIGDIVQGISQFTVILKIITVDGHLIIIDIK